MIIQSIVQSVFQPIVRSVIDPIIISQGFSPKSLFTSGKQGAWYDPSDLSTMFQDSAGATPVTAAGQPVGLLRDKSGRGNHAIQATAGSKPILRSAGNLWYLEFDGVDDFLVTTSVNFTATDKMSVFTGLRKLSDASVSIVVELSKDSNTQDGAFFLAAPVGGSTANIAFRSNGTIKPSSSIVKVDTLTNAVVSALSDISAPSLAMRVNGWIGPTIATTQGIGNYGNYPLYIGRRGGTSLPFTGYLYGLIIRGALTDAAGITNTEKYLAAKSGVTL